MSGFDLTVKAGEILHIWQKPKGAGPSRVQLGEVVLTGPASDDFQRVVHLATGAETRADWDESTNSTVPADVRAAATKPTNDTASV